MLLIASHPEWVRGLKHCDLRVFGKMDLSHPEWVRGLKLLKPFKEIAIHRVAPRVGAWIETQLTQITQTLTLSHPEWVRGLKQYGVDMVLDPLRRTPSGCVD